MTGISIGEEQFTVGPVARLRGGVEHLRGALGGRRLHVAGDDLQRPQPGDHGRPRPRTASVGCAATSPSASWTSPGSRSGPARTTRPRTSSTSPTPSSRPSTRCSGWARCPPPCRSPPAPRSGMVRSEDGGRSWSTPVGGEPHRQPGVRQPGRRDAPGVFGTDRTVQGSQPAVGPDGTAVGRVAGQHQRRGMKGAGEIYLAQSKDKGETFGTRRRRPSRSTRSPTGRATPSSASGAPSSRSSPWARRASCTSPTPPSPPTDRATTPTSDVVPSTDDGQTWTRPRRMNDDDGDGDPVLPVDRRGAQRVGARDVGRHARRPRGDALPHLLHPVDRRRRDAGASRSRTWTSGRATPG